MSLTIHVTAELYNLSRNPNYVKIETNNYLYSENIGDRAVGIFTGLAANVLNQTFTINWNLTSRTYTFKNALNIGALEVNRYTAGLTTTYIAQLVAELNTDPALTNFFLISQRDSSIVLTAKLPGPQFSLTTSSTSVGAFYNDTVGTNDVQILARENFKIVTELFQETAANSNVFQHVITISKEPSDNIVELDLAPFIDNCLEYKFPDQYLISQTAYLCLQTCKKFYVRNYEVYGSPPVQQGSAFQTFNYPSLKAGFGNIMSKVYPNSQFNYYFGHNSFLTRQNRVKKIARYQIEFLYFLFPANIAGSAMMRTRCYNTDGSVDTFNGPFTTAGVKAGNVWAFPANGEMGYLTDTRYYKIDISILLQGSNTVISEIFTYVADDGYYQDELFLYFANTDGGLDTVRMSGKKSTDIDFTRETSKRTRTVNDNPYQGNTTQLVNQKTNVVTAFSGWITKKELDWIEDLFLSKRIFTYRKTPTSMIEVPVIITSTSRGPHKSDDTLFGFAVDYYEDLASELPDIAYHPY